MQHPLETTILYALFAITDLRKMRLLNVDKEFHHEPSAAHLLTGFFERWSQMKVPISNLHFMNAFIQRFSVITGFSLLALLLSSTRSSPGNDGFRSGRKPSWLVHSAQVQHQLTQIELLVTDAETGQRGYLFTGDPKYLNPYQNTIVTFGSSIDDLAQLTADNPVQQADVGKLRDLVHGKLGELAETIALYQAGKDADAKAMVMSDRGLMS